MTTVAVVGLGAMGSRVARRFLGAGHDVVVWNRTPERARPLLDAGARAAASPAEAARRADVTVTMVAGPAALDAVTNGSGGIAAAGAPVSVVEMSTVGPDAVARLAAALPAGSDLVDAPVLGSISEADSGTLKVFAGGPAPLVERWTPLLSALGTVIHVGPLGAGAAAKLVANSALFGTLCLVGETVALADALGLSRAAAFEVLAATPLRQQSERRRPVIESGEFPARFSLALARKDAELAAAAAVGADLDVPVIDAARRWIASAQDAGLGDADYAAVLAHILDRVERRARR